MSKNKFNTIIIISGMFIYYLFSQIYLNKFGSVFVNIINPLVFVLLAFFMKITLISPRSKKIYKVDIIRYVIIAILAYVLVYFISGIFTGFGKSPYITSFAAILYNLYTTGVIVFCEEYIRFKLINNVSAKEKKIIFILIVVSFTFFDINISSLFNGKNIYFIAKNIFSILLPVVVKNILFTYLSKVTNFVPSFLYAISMYLVLWIPPILPNSPWVLNAILDTMFPLILFIYCRYYIYKVDRFHLKKLEPFNPRGMIPLSIALILVIWFALGIFPIRPVGVATGSMEPNIHIGDMVIVDQNVTSNDIEVGNIIQYQLEKYTVIHRVVKKYQKDGYTYFVTKGDYNRNNDLKPVEESQLRGKVIYRIPYIALPTIWLNRLSENQKEVIVETGDFI